MAAILIVVACLFVLIFLYGSAESGSQLPRQQENEQLQHEKSINESRKTLWQKARTDPIAMFTFWLMLFTAVLSIVGVIQLKLLSRAEAIARYTAQAASESANAAKQATEIAERTLVSGNRAWIKVDVQPAGPISYNINGANFTFRFTLTNIGRSPATNVSID